MKGLNRVLNLTATKIVGVVFSSWESHWSYMQQKQKVVKQLSFRYTLWHVGRKTRAEWIKRHQQKKTLAVRKNLKWQQLWDLSRTSLKHFWALERCPLTTSPSSSSTNGKMSTFIFMFIATFFSSSSSFQCFTRSASFLIAASFLVGYSQYFGTPIHCEIVSYNQE